MNNIESFIIEYFDNKKEDPVLLDIIETSMQYLLVYHSIFLISNKLFSLYDNFEIVKYIVDGYAKECTVESLNQLLKLYERVEYNEYYSLALSKMIKEEQKLLLHLIDQYDKLKDPNVHKYIAKVLTNKMEYILLKLQDENTKNYHNIIVDLLQDGYNSSIIEFLNENNTLTIEIGGHTDSRGTNNLALSQSRAEAVYNYLVSKGIDSKRLTSKGYGSSAPVYSDEYIKKLSTEREIENAHQSNRRTEYKIIKK